MFVGGRSADRGDVKEQDLTPNNSALSEMSPESHEPSGHRAWQLQKNGRLPGTIGCPMFALDDGHCLP